MTKDCENCKQAFHFSPSRASTKRFCSTACYSQFRTTKIQAKCLGCDATFRVHPSRADYGRGKFCSAKCQYRMQSGPNCHLWKGGVTPANKAIRTSTKYKQWREQVFRRDDYTCQACGDRGVALHADHDLPFAYFPDLRFELLNGRTLCETCHRATSTWGNGAALIHSFA